MKFKILPMLLALSVLPASTVWADDEIETGQVVISASRIEQAIEDVSANIEVITAEEIQKMGMTNVSDIFAAQLNVSSGRPSIRALGANYTLFLIDGRKPVGSENGGDGSASFLASINVNNIERIEIIKGAAATMYGSDAMGGVVNIITKKGMEPSGAITTSISNETLLTNYYYDFGRIGNWTAKMDANFSQDLGLAVEGYTVTTDGNWEDSGAYTSNGVGHDYSFGGNLGYYFDNHTVLGSYSYQAFREIAKTYSSKDEFEIALTSKNHRLMYHNAGVDVSGSFGDHQYTFMPTFSLSTFENTDNLSSNSSTKHYQFIDAGFTAMDAFPINDWNLISVGADYTFSALEHSSLVYAGVDTTADNMHKAGAFVQDEILLFSESLILLPSIRFDYGNMSNPQLTARFGTTWEFMPDQRIKFNIGNAYRTPNLNELAGAETKSTSYSISNNTVVGTTITHDTDGNAIVLADGDYASGVTIGNQDLEAETAINIDARYEGKFGNITTSIGGYYITKDNAISTTDIIAIVNQGDSSYRVVNERCNLEGLSYYTGLEAEISADFATYFNASLGYSFMKNWHEDDYDLGGYAPHNLAYSLGFNYDDLDVFASLWGNAMFAYQQRAETHNSYDADSAYNYFDLNVSVGKIFSNKYTVVLSANDILQSSRVWKRTDGEYTSNSGWTNPEYKLTFTAAF